jgi:NAD(P)H-nitrite reductase large subunit
MPGDETFVIVGASLAGAKAAETLRDEGFDGRLVLVGAEDTRPYERPPLSKDYPREVGRENVYVHDEGFYGERDTTTCPTSSPTSTTSMEYVGFARASCSAATPRAASSSPSG